PGALIGSSRNVIRTLTGSWMTHMGRELDLPVGLERGAECQHNDSLQLRDGGEGLIVEQAQGEPTARLFGLQRRAAEGWNWARSRAWRMMTPPWRCWSARLATLIPLRGPPQGPVKAWHRLMPSSVQGHPELVTATGEAAADEGDVPDAGRGGRIGVLDQVLVEAGDGIGAPGGVFRQRPATDHDLQLAAGLLRGLQGGLQGGLAMAAVALTGAPQVVRELGGDGTMRAGLSIIAQPCGAVADGLGVLAGALGGVALGKGCCKIQLKLRV
ncbi:hypothetical protein Thi970DRAFT_00402, partial [Thiorhodovibrio frisius]